MLSQAAVTVFLPGDFLCDEALGPEVVLAFVEADAGG
jgi:hypothetical protein